MRAEVAVGCIAFQRIVEDETLDAASDPAKARYLVNYLPSAGSVSRQCGPVTAGYSVFYPSSNRGSPSVRRLQRPTKIRAGSLLEFTWSRASQDGSVEVVRGDWSAKHRHPTMRLHSSANG